VFVKKIKKTENREMHHFGLLKAQQFLFAKKIEKIKNPGFRVQRVKVQNIE